MRIDPPKKPERSVGLHFLGSGEILTEQSARRWPPEALKGKADSLILELGKSNSERGRDLPKVTQHVNSRTGTTHSEMSEIVQSQAVETQACGRGQITTRN